MSRLVAIDTSTWWGGIALVESSSDRGQTVVVAEAGLLVKDSHAIHILALLDPLLAEAGWSRSSPDAYAATRGPGSFTGLRVALGTVRGLALAAGRPAFGVGTLEAMAEAHGIDERDRLPMLDAGRGEVYSARYSPDSDPPLELAAPSVGPPTSIVKAAGEASPVAFGPGAARHREELTRLGVVVREGPRDVAAAAARLAATLLERGEPDGTGLAPLYVRPPDAVLK